MDNGARALVELLLEHLDPAPKRGGLEETPARYVKAWRHWTSGHDVDVPALLKTFEDGRENYDEMIFVGNIPFYSHCEHHLAPFFGIAHVAYIPGHKRGILGLSKIPRLVDAFARRLTVQERITTQVANAMQTLGPRGVGVLLQARHMCVESRGVAKTGTITTTSSLLGLMKTEPEVRAEFLKMVELQRGVL